MDFVADIQTRVNEFDWVSGVTPLSTWKTPTYVCTGYLAIVFGCKLLVHLQKRNYAKQLTGFVVFHNFFLSFASLLLLIGLVWQLVLDGIAVGGGFGKGLWGVWCDEPRRFNKGFLYLVYYINYLFKFYEMIDTFLLALRGKPTPFLHVYHHAATLVLCWSQLKAHSATMWVPIGLNLMVHVIMYYYYAIASLGKTVWWKQYLTTLQIVQFVIDVVVCTYAVTTKYLHDSTNGAHPWGHDCSGTVSAGVFGTGLLFSYLVLFINLYIGMYIVKKLGKMGKAGAKKAA